jgi:hypothetical protein
MSEESLPEKKKKKRSSTKNKKRLDLSLLAVIDNMVFNKTDAWAYYKVTNQAFDFLTSAGQASLLQKLTNAFNNLMNDRQESLEMHLISTSVPIDIDAWQEQVKTISNDWDRPPGFEEYLEEVTSFLKNEAYHTKTVYIGVNLGKRGALEVDRLNVFEAGVKGAMDYGKEWLNKALMIPDEDIDEKEEAVVRKKEENIYRNISVGHLGAERASAEELLLLIKRQLYPAMPAPYLDVDHESRLGAGDIALEASSVIENKYRWIKIKQIIDDEPWEGYRATLSMSKFPKEMTFPGSMPFLYYIQKIGLPFTTFARFTLHPSRKMKLELEKKRKEQRDELENLSAAMDGYDSAISGVPEHVQEALQDSQMLSSMLSSDNTAWLEGSYFIVIETPTEELLRKYISVVKQYYSDLDININWTAGDQAILFLSQMPGDKHRMKSFDQMTNLTMLPSSGFNFSSDVGDPIYGNEGAVSLNG